MKILIAGGSGLVGQRLSKLLQARGHSVAHLSRTVRSGQKFPTFIWNVLEQTIDLQAFEGVDVVVNLAGEGIADARWTAKRKQAIVSSRVDSVRLLKVAMNSLQKKPIYIAASAIGYYGNTGDALTDENSRVGSGFMADCCRSWEEASWSLADTTARLAILRIGVVLSKQGGALPKNLGTLRFGLATYFGKGQQFFPWIHIEDVCNVIIFSIENNHVQGIFNAVSPTPITSYQFAEALADVRGGFHIKVSAPAFVLRLALGEMADVVLQGSRVSAQKIMGAGFRFQFPTISLALKDLW